MQKPGSGSTVAAAAADRAASFSAQTLSGKKVSFPNDYAGKLVLVDFWATWCMPCRGEIPHLKAAHDKFAGRGLEILGISLDNGPVAGVERFLKQHGMTWPQIRSGGSSIAARFGVTGIPAPFLVDGNSGAILASGDDLRGNALLRTITKHLK